MFAKYFSLLLSLIFAACVFGDNVLVEAESFSNLGGWKLDTQFIENMGSPYLLAHGLGRPVENAPLPSPTPETAVQLDTDERQPTSVG